MAMARGPPLHRRPRGAGAAETTSWAVGGAPHMSSTPIWLVGHRGQAAIAATGVSGAALNSLFYRSNCLTGSAGHSHCRRVLVASSGRRAGGGRRSLCPAAIGGLDPGVTRKWLAGRLAGCCLLIDRLHGLNSLFLIIRSACMHD